MSTDLRLPIPACLDSKARIAFLERARQLSLDPESPIQEGMNTAGRAGLLVIRDLARQGWNLEIGVDSVTATPVDELKETSDERDRVRKQELIKRDAQLSTPSVARFVQQMESPRIFGDRFVSIFSLMRDGSELADKLLALHKGDLELGEVINPYVQVVEPGKLCEQTGIRLTDVWRYFRHTWTNQLSSTPGRTMMLIVRDRAAEYHPVIGIAALGSAVVQMKERDDWIGWQREQILAVCDREPTDDLAAWIWRRLETQRSEIYVEDLIRDDLYWPSMWESPTTTAIEALKSEAVQCRTRHQRYVQRADLRKSIDPEDPAQLQSRTESALYRGKRCENLSRILEARRVLLPFFGAGATEQSLREAMRHRQARAVIGSIGRQAKSEAVGTEIADLTVCGAVAPYNEILGGKLVSMLAVGPTTVLAYNSKYGRYPSVIASTLAGRPIRRRNQLVFIGTTSLYGTNSSQYNRVTVPAETVGGHSELRYVRFGRSKSYGTSHLADETVQALQLLTEQSNQGRRVNSLFGEGVSPRLRKVRHGLDLLGWPSNGLLQHGRRRIIYGIELVDNLLPYLLGLDHDPAYRMDLGIADDVDRITHWWAQRWLVDRISARADRLRKHSVDRPVQHGARVISSAP